MLGIPTATSTNTTSLAGAKAATTAENPELPDPNSDQEQVAASEPEQEETSAQEQVEAEPVVQSATVEEAQTFSSTTATQQQYDAVITRYLVTSEGGSPVFDEERARQERASEDALELGATFNEVALEQAPTLDVALEDPRALATRGVAPQGTTPAALTLPIYGNWCGPGYGSGTPVDTLDNGCMQHDNCYGLNGYFSCSCDFQLIADINIGWRQMRTREKIYATAVKAYFTIQTKVLLC